jgi:hypothetical protein
LEAFLVCLIDLDERGQFTPYLRPKWQDGHAMPAMTPRGDEDHC